MAKEKKKRHRSRKHKVRAVKKGRSTYEPLDEKFNKEIDEMTQHERLEFDRIKEHGFISWVCGGCRLPRQHKPTCKFKRLPFSALVATTDNLDMVPKLFSTISTNSTTFPSPLQSNNVSSTSLPKISTSSSNFESLGLDSEGDNYDETSKKTTTKKKKLIKPSMIFSPIIQIFSLRITLSP